MVVTAQDLTRRQADSLSVTLGKPIADTERIKTLLNLALFNVHQRRISDSTVRVISDYIGGAEKLNKKLKVRFFNEQVRLIRSALYKAQGNRTAGKALLAQLIAELDEKDNKSLLGKAYFEMSEYYSGSFLHDTMVERIRYLKLAIAAFQQTNGTVDLARMYRFLADLHLMMNNNSDAFVEIRTALKYYEQAGYTEKQGALSLLGRLYYEQGDYKQALSYELMALRVATSSSDDNVRLICQINNNIGYTYTKLNENQKALQYFMQSLRIAEQDKDNGTIYLLAANVADAYLKLNAPSDAMKFFQHITRTYPMPAQQQYESGDFGFSLTYLNIYMALKQYDKAKFYCEQLIRHIGNPNINLFSLSLDYELIATYYIGTANYERAQYYLTKDKELVDSLKNLSGISQNYQLWFSLDTANGKYKEAITNLMESNRVKDSIFDATKSQQIAQLEVEFQTEKKEAQINFLSQKAVLESTKVKQADFVRNVTVAGVILLLIIAGLLYKQSSLRKKSNVIVTHKNEQLQRLLTEKEWLLKEVHHRVKNNLHTVICLLESQARYLEEDALRAIESSQNRIFAMSLIHQKLYQSDDIGAIEVDVYIAELTNYLSESFGAPSNVSIQLQLEKVMLNLSQAIPLGLIINEALTNALKYAFPNRRTGKIAIELKLSGSNIQILIADNGVGMPKLKNSGLPKSLGLDLIRGLTSELQGTVHFESNTGTRILVCFPMEEINSSLETTLFHSVNSLSI
ncbi:MAG TPA: histidine kinase dimerization/phosphoacceptor domain -containing protein [Puia sp.]